MKIVHTDYWEKKKRRYRPDISDYFIEYCIQNSPIIKDRLHENALNAISRVPSSGRILKVAYRTEGKDIKVIITAYWLD